MKLFIFSAFLSLICSSPLLAQEGLYTMSVDTTQHFRIKKDKERLILEVVGQGQTDLSPLGGNRYIAKKVSPPATLEFVPDSMGRFRTFIWLQDRRNIKTEMIRQPAETGVDPQGYPGLYKAKNNPYLNMRVSSEQDQLSVQVADRVKLPMTPLSKDRYMYKKGEFTVWYEFKRDKAGNIRKLLTSEYGPLNFIRADEDLAMHFTSDRDFNQRKQFSRADSLRGMLTPLRTCYDVLFYGLDMTIRPETKSIDGRTIIRFRAVQPFERMQIDLHANMKIEKILYHDQELAYSREHHAVYIQFPHSIDKGSTGELVFYISGKPRVPDIEASQGGFIWWRDRNGSPWIESVCQGSGASLWWPCKDHQSDKPDSMTISITVPSGLMDISNGRLLQTTDLPGQLTRYDWYVDYPINAYNVVVNIGKYAHLSDSLIREHDTLRLNYYFLPYHLDKAKQVFKDVKPMLAAYERNFGKYPFSKDGFSIMESLYPMEHQGAVSVGSFTNPVNSDKFDPADLQNTVFHESAHEWWGNSVTCKDMADFWIHESFATYAQVLAKEAISGHAAALAYLKDQQGQNKEPIIGFYDVNDFHMGDMYPKGCRILHTLRNVIANDSVWFSILRGIQLRFQYQAVTTEDIVNYISRATGKDYKPFFDQYLRYAHIPILDLLVRKDGESLSLQYKWTADIKQFDVPVKIQTAPGHFECIYPGDNWQTTKIPAMKPETVAVDTDDFYIQVNKQIIPNAGY